MFNIKQIRKNVGLTQLELATKVGTSREYINGIENGHKVPSIDMLTKIAKELNTTIKGLIEEPA